MRLAILLAVFGVQLLHGCMFDMSFNRPRHDLLYCNDETGRLIAAVCHVPAAFAGMRRP